MLDSHWRDVAVIAELRAQRSSAPRSAGMTMVIDTGLGVAATADILEVAGDYIDLWKLSFGTSVFVRPTVLERKLELINARKILSCPGGTLFEAAILQHPCSAYATRAAEVGFTAVEISDAGDLIGRKPCAEIGRTAPGDGATGCEAIGARPTKAGCTGVETAISSSISWRGGTCRTTS